MAGFSGNIEAKIDDKGRVFVPSVYRKLLEKSGESELVIRRSPENETCIHVYPLSVWEQQVAELKSRLNLWNPKEKQIFRQFVSMAISTAIDGQGRILTNKELCQSVGIDSEVTFVGMEDYFELWDRQAFKDSLKDDTLFSDVLSQKMMGPAID